MTTKQCPLFLALALIALSASLQDNPVKAQSVNESGSPTVDREQLRRRAVRQIDAKASLDLLTHSLVATQDPKIQTALMRGMLSGLEGRRNVTTPEGWDKLSLTLQKSTDANVVKMHQRLGQIFGDQAATARALATLRNQKAPISNRRSALKSLVTQRNPQLKKELAGLLDDSKIRLDIIRAYSAIEDPLAPKNLLARYADLDFPERRALVETLATRKNYSLALVEAVASKVVPKQDIPAYIARSLQKQHGKKFTDAYGDIAALSKDKAALIARYKKLLSPQALSKGNPAKGHAVFQRTCSPCHYLYDEGGRIGPDLTGSNRADLNYILLNMLDPSGDIPDAYKLVTVTTKEGQVLAGTIAEEDDQRIVINMVGQRSTVLKNDIQSRDIAPISMMPEGLLQTLENHEVIDLVRYLRSTQQVPLPK